MGRLPRSLATLALFVVVSVPTIMFVIASCVGAAYVQQIMLTTSFPQRRQR